jgi:hypothetical protein
MSDSEDDEGIGNLFGDDRSDQADVEMFSSAGDNEDEGSSVADSSDDYEVSQPSGWNKRHQVKKRDRPQSTNDGRGEGSATHRSQKKQKAPSKIHVNPHPITIPSDSLNSSWIPANGMLHQCDGDNGIGQSCYCKYPLAINISYDALKIVERQRLGELDAETSFDDTNARHIISATASILGLVATHTNGIIPNGTQVESKTSRKKKPNDNEAMDANEDDACKESEEPEESKRDRKKTMHDYLFMFKETDSDDLDDPTGGFKVMQMRYCAIERVLMMPEKYVELADTDKPEHDPIFVADTNKPASMSPRSIGVRVWFIVMDPNFNDWTAIETLMRANVVRRVQDAKRNITSNNLPVDERSVTYAHNAARDVGSYAELRHMIEAYTGDLAEVKLITSPDCTEPVPLTEFDQMSLNANSNYWRTYGGQQLHPLAAESVFDPSRNVNALRHGWFRFNTGTTAGLDRSCVDNIWKIQLEPSTYIPEGRDFTKPQGMVRLRFPHMLIKHGLVHILDPGLRDVLVIPIPSDPMRVSSMPTTVLRMFVEYKGTSTKDKGLLYCGSASTTATNCFTSFTLGEPCHSSQGRSALSKLNDYSRQMQQDRNGTSGSDTNTYVDPQKRLMQIHERQEHLIRSWNNESKLFMDLILEKGLFTVSPIHFRRILLRCIVNSMQFFMNDPSMDICALVHCLISPRSTSDEESTLLPSEIALFMGDFVANYKRLAQEIGDNPHKTSISSDDWGKLLQQRINHFVPTVDDSSQTDPTYHPFEQHPLPDDFTPFEVVQSLVDDMTTSDFVFTRDTDNYSPIIDVICGRLCEAHGIYPSLMQLDGHYERVMNEVRFESVLNRRGRNLPEELNDVQPGAARASTAAGSSNDPLTSSVLPMDIDYRHAINLQLSAIEDSDITTNLTSMFKNGLSSVKTPRVDALVHTAQKIIAFNLNHIKRKYDPKPLMRSLNNRIQELSDIAMNEYLDGAINAVVSLVNRNDPFYPSAHTRRVTASLKRLQEPDAELFPSAELTGEWSSFGHAIQTEARFARDVCNFGLGDVGIVQWFAIVLGSLEALVNQPKMGSKFYGARGKGKSTGLKQAAEVMLDGSISKIGNASKMAKSNGRTDYDASLAYHDEQPAFFTDPRDPAVNLMKESLTDGVLVNDRTEESNFRADGQQSKFATRRIITHHGEKLVILANEPITLGPTETIKALQDRFSHYLYNTRSTEENVDWKNVLDDPKIMARVREHKTTEALVTLLLTLTNCIPAFKPNMNYSDAMATQLQRRMSIYNATPLTPRQHEQRRVTLTVLCAINAVASCFTYQRAFDKASNTAHPVDYNEPFNMMMLKRCIQYMKVPTPEMCSFAWQMAVYGSVDSAPCMDVTKLSLAMTFEMLPTDYELELQGERNQLTQFHRRETFKQSVNLGNAPKCVQESVNRQLDRLTLRKYVQLSDNLNNTILFSSISKLPQARIPDEFIQHVSVPYPMVSKFYQNANVMETSVPMQSAFESKTNKADSDGVFRTLRHPPMRASSSSFGTTYDQSRVTCTRFNSYTDMARFLCTNSNLILNMKYEQEYVKDWLNILSSIVIPTVVFHSNTAPHSIPMSLIWNSSDKPSDKPSSPMRGAVTPPAAPASTARLQPDSSSLMADDDDDECENDECENDECENDEMDTSPQNNDAAPQNADEVVVDSSDDEFSDDDDMPVICPNIGLDHLNGTVSKMNAQDRITVNQVMTSFKQYFGNKNNAMLQRFELMKQQGKAQTCTKLNPFNWECAARSCLQSPIDYQFAESESSTANNGTTDSNASSTQQTKFSGGLLTISAPFLHSARTVWMAASYACGMHPQIKGYQDPRMVNGSPCGFRSSCTVPSGGIITPIFEEMCLFYKIMMSVQDCFWKFRIDDCGYTMHHVTVFTNPSGNKDEMLGVAMGEYARKHMFEQFDDEDEDEDENGGVSTNTFGKLRNSTIEQMKSKPLYPSRYYYEASEKCNVPVKDSRALNQSADEIGTVAWVQHQLRFRDTNDDPLIDFRRHILSSQCLDGIISNETVEMTAEERREFYTMAFEEHLNPTSMRKMFRPKAFGPSVMEANKRIERESNLRRMVLNTHSSQLKTEDFHFK